MAITKIADVIVPELFNRYVINRTMELSAFFQSGIVVNSPDFDALASEASRTHNMPFFEDLQGESEAILEDVKMTAKKSDLIRMYQPLFSVRICGEQRIFQQLLPVLIR